MHGTDRLIEHLFASYGLAAKLEEHRIIAAWPEIVGPQIAAHAAATEIRAHTLRVAVDSSPWLHELSLLKPVLLRKLDQFAGRRLVHDVLFVIGEVPSRRPGEPTARSPRILSPEEADQIAEAVASLNDPELRATAERLLRRSLADT
ncbi:MAG: DUF721 domain-containing protein [Nitrospiria bacterium]